MRQSCNYVTTRMPITATVTVDSQAICLTQPVRDCRFLGMKVDTTSLEVRGRQVYRSYAGLIADSAAADT